MADRLVDVPDPAPSGAASAPVLVQERPSTSVAAALTADPGTSGTTFTFASTAVFPQTGTFKAKVENEVVLAAVASGTTLTVTRAQDGTTAVAHAVGKVVAALAIVEYVAPISNRQVSYLGSLATFRTLGNAASPQNLFSFENAAVSPVLVAIRALKIDQDSTAILTALANQFKLSRPAALPTGGTVLTKVALDTALTSDANVVARGATASDGGAATAITATAGAPMWCQMASRQMSTSGQWLPDDNDLLPLAITNTDGIILRPGQAILVQVVNPTAANNASTNHYTVRCAFEEFTLP